MKLKNIILSVLISLITFASAYSQSGSYAGAFSRYGFGARGLAKGNAMVSDVFGDVSGYYNPSLAAFQEQGFANIGYTFLSLDRKLNFLGFSKKIKLPNQKNGGAGISFSWINSGVTDIDGRDNDGKKIGDFNTFENQFYLGTSFLIEENLALGVGFKLYYSKLFEEVSTTSVGFDLGAVFLPTPDLALGIAVKDISAKYKWETIAIYGSNGKITEDKFPTLLNIGGTYKLPKNLGLASLELEAMFAPALDLELNDGTITKSEKETFYYLKAGAEINLIDNLKVRAGLDRIYLKGGEFQDNLRPSAGLSFTKSFTKDIILGLDYAFVYEPYSNDAIQNVSVIFKFK